MSTIIQDQQLEYELQELYILSKHWISDIDFIEDEVRILKDVIHKYLAHVENLQLKERKNFEKILLQQDANIPELKHKVLEFLKFMKPLVKGAKEEIGLNLIEKFTTLETAMKSVSAYVKLLRKLLYAFTEDVMKAEKIISL